MTHSRCPMPKSRTRWIVLGALGLLASALVLADDRQLFRQAADSPYVFTLLDVSGSMNWNAGFPDGNFRDGDADAPGSRLFEAKSALYEVIQGLNPSIRLGFAHFGQPDLEALRKLWLYERAPGQANPPWWSELPFPAEDRSINFGQAVVDGTDANYRDCPNAYSGGDAITRAEMFPKMQDAGTTISLVYIQWGGNRYGIRFRNLAPSLGATNITVAIQVTRAKNSNCMSNEMTVLGERTLTFRPRIRQDNEGNQFSSEMAGPLGFDYISWRETLANESGDSGWSADHYNQGDSCKSPYWSPNGTPATGTQSPLSSLRYQTFNDPLGRDATSRSFARGEVVPWDWLEHPTTTVPGAGFEVSSRQEILRRLAPNTAVSGEYVPDANGQPVPDFRVARYLKDHPSGGFLGVKTQFSRYPPITAVGATPVAGSLNKLADWYQKWEPVAKGQGGDPSFGCRQRYVILLTDGEETCGGTPATAAARLEALGIRVFVIAFGGDLSGNKVQAIADSGGTGDWDTNADGVRDCAEFTFTEVEGPAEDLNGNGIPGETYETDTCPGPIAAPDRASLVRALRNIFGSVDARPSSFASAATNPSRSAAGNSLFLTSFLPLPRFANWDGAVSHYVQPLPTRLDPNGNRVPDPTKLCDGLDPARSCLAWDAGKVMLGDFPGSVAQSPGDTEFMSNLRIGGDPDERRVIYSQEPTVPGAVPRASRLFEPPTGLANEYDLWNGLLGPSSYIVGNAASEATARTQARNTMEQTLRIKTAPDPTADPPGSTNVSYVLGDVFHSSPTLVAAPNQLRYRIFNLHNYRNFYDRHEFRRRVLMVGSNDAQLHAFDAGIFEPEFNGSELDRTKSAHNLGSGQELFSFVPRALLPRLRAMTVTPDEHEFSVDASAVVDDFFVDPIHSGTPTATDREWRTLAIGGLREGGRTYYALDITQPDHDTITGGVHIPDPLGVYVPSCMAQTAYNATACGPLPYAAVRWEFTDTTDLDLNGFVDLGDTWSQPNTGRIKLVDSSGVPLERYVAIFGGGLDPDNFFGVGNFLYMVDVETGKAIYKRALGGIGGGRRAVGASGGRHHR